MSVLDHHQLDWVDWDRFFSLHEDRREVDEDDLYERVSEDIEHQDYWKEIDSETEFCKTRKVCHDDLDQWAKENNKDYGFHTVLEMDVILSNPDDDSIHYIELKEVDDYGEKARKQLERAAVFMAENGWSLSGTEIFYDSSERRHLTRQDLTNSEVRDQSTELEKFHPSPSGWNDPKSPFDLQRMHEVRRDIIEVDTPESLEKQDYYLCKNMSIDQSKVDKRVSSHFLRKPENPVLMAWDSMLEFSDLDTELFIEAEDILGLSEHLAVDYERNSVYAVVWSKPEDFSWGRR